MEIGRLLDYFSQVTSEKSGNLVAPQLRCCSAVHDADKLHTW